MEIRLLALFLPFFFVLGCSPEQEEPACEEEIPIQSYWLTENNCLNGAFANVSSSELVRMTDPQSYAEILSCTNEAPVEVDFAEKIVLLSRYSANSVPFGEEQRFVERCTGELIYETEIMVSDFTALGTVYSLAVIPREFYNQEIHLVRLIK